MSKIDQLKKLTRESSLERRITGEASPEEKSPVETRNTKEKSLKDSREKPAGSTKPKPKNIETTQEKKTQKKIATSVSIPEGIFKIIQTYCSLVPEVNVSSIVAELLEKYIAEHNIRGQVKKILQDKLKDF